jgi:hypothetical protein
MERLGDQRGGGSEWEPIKVLPEGRTWPMPQIHNQGGARRAVMSREEPWADEGKAQCWALEETRPTRGKDIAREVRQATELDRFLSQIFFSLFSILLRTAPGLRTELELELLWASILRTRTGLASRLLFDLDTLIGLLPLHCMHQSWSYAWVLCPHQMLTTMLGIRFA